MTHLARSYQTYWCDQPGCNESFEAEGAAFGVIGQAREDGWQGTAYGSKHYCPVHAPAHRRSGGYIS